MMLDVGASVVAHVCQLTVPESVHILNLFHAILVNTFLLPQLLIMNKPCYTHSFGPL